MANYTLLWISYYFQTRDITADNIGYDVFQAMDDFRLALLILNLILTVLIIVFYDSYPEGTFPTLSQQYHRQKMYEPHLDVKYLLRYREFKVYAIICCFLFTAINVAQSVPATFLFVEAQANINVYKTSVIWAPLMFLAGLVVSALILCNFQQTNEAYKRYIMLLVISFAGSLAFNMFAFVTKSPALYILATLIQSGVCGALELYLYEFMTEIIFPVSPVFALAILHSLSGLLSLLVQMFSDDVIYKDPNDVGY